MLSRIVLFVLLPFTFLTANVTDFFPPENQHIVDVEEAKKVFRCVFPEWGTGMYGQPNWYGSKLWEINEEAGLSTQMDQAMALDFAARYLNEGPADKEEFSTYLDQIRPYYDHRTPSFVAREDIFNRRLAWFDDPEPQWRDSEEEFSFDDRNEALLQKLANYHHIKIEPLAPSFKIESIEDFAETLKNVEITMNNLPDGVYIISAYDLNDQNLIIFIKGQSSFLFFDINTGAFLWIPPVDDELDVSMAEMLDEIFQYQPFDNFRIYRATCSEGCINIAS